MDEMTAARYNVYWYMALGAPALVMLLATTWRRRSVLIIGAVVSLVATYMLCNAAVVEKWRIRNQVAKTDAEREYATTDGANVVFTAFVLGPIESAVYTTLWGFVGWQFWSRLRSESGVRPN